jgi:hypothetical protein
MWKRRRGREGKRMCVFEYVEGAERRGEERRGKNREGEGVSMCMPLFLYGRGEGREGRESVCVYMEVTEGAERRGKRRK